MYTPGRKSSYPCPLIPFPLDPLECLTVGPYRFPLKWMEFAEVFFTLQGKNTCKYLKVLILICFPLNSRGISTSFPNVRKNGRVHFKLGTRFTEMSRIWPMISRIFCYRKSHKQIIMEFQHCLSVKCDYRERYWVQWKHERTISPARGAIREGRCLTWVLRTSKMWKKRWKGN